MSARAQADGLAVPARVVHEREQERGDVRARDAQRQVELGRDDQHRGEVIVVVAGELVRDEGVRVEVPEQGVERFGLVAVAGVDQGRDLLVVRVTSSRPPPPPAPVAGTGGW